MAGVFHSSCRWRVYAWNGFLRWTLALGRCCLHLTHMWCRFEPLDPESAKNQGMNYAMLLLQFWIKYSFHDLSYSHLYLVEHIFLWAKVEMGQDSCGANVRHWQTWLRQAHRQSGHWLAFTQAWKTGRECCKTTWKEKKREQIKNKMTYCMCMKKDETNKNAGFCDCQQSLCMGCNSKSLKQDKELNKEAATNNNKGHISSQNLPYKKSACFVTHHLSKTKKERIQMLCTRLCQSRSVHVRAWQSSEQRPVGLMKDPVSLRGGWLQFWHLSSGAPFPEWPNILNWTTASGLENEGGHRCRPSPWFIALGRWVPGQRQTHIQMQGINSQMHLQL